MLTWAKWCKSAVDVVQAANWPGVELVAVWQDPEDKWACWAFLRGDAHAQAAFVNHGEEQRPRWSVRIG